MGVNLLHGVGKKYKIVWHMVFVVLIITGIFALLPVFQKQSEGQSVTFAASTAATITKKVLVLNFNPYITGTTVLTTSKGWNDPLQLQNQYVSDIKNASHSVVDYQIVRTETIHSFPVKQSGFTFTNAQYRGCLSDPSPSYCLEIINYQKLVDDYNLCGQVTSGAIDEVWLWGGPYMGYYEWTTAGPDSPPFISRQAQCSKRFFIMGFSYERSNMAMMHDMGHRAENILSNIFGGYPYTDPPRLGNPWNRFWPTNITTPDNSSCGYIHYPPNSRTEYDYQNSASVTSHCADWLNYPSTNGSVGQVTCTSWNCVGDGPFSINTGNFFEKYWLNHLPYKTGTRNNILNNWWGYIVDYDAAKIPIAYGEKWYAIENSTQDSASGCTQNLGVNDIWIGSDVSCANGKYTAIFDFTNIQVPKDAAVADAFLEGVSGGIFSNPLSEQIVLTYGSFTTSPVSWSIANAWSTQSVVRTPSLASALAQIFHTSSWTPGGTIRVQIQHISGSGSRSLFAFEREPMAGARLIMNVQGSSVTPSISIPGDLNRDFHVDIYDYNIFLGDFGKTGTAGFIPADINRDGLVNIFDYNLLVGDFGR